MDGPQQPVFPRGHPLYAQLKGDIIESKGLRLAAIDVTGELVSEEDESQLAVNRRLPVAEKTFASSKDQRLEPPADLVVDAWDLRPPEGGTLLRYPGIIGVAAEPVPENCESIFHWNPG